MTWVKICGIRTPEEALAVARTGVAAVGFNLHRRSRRYIDVYTARQISEVLIEHYPDVARVGVVVDLPGGLSEHLEVGRRGLLTHIQLHGDEPDELADELCDRGWSVIRAIRVGAAETAADVAERIESSLDGTDGRCRVLVDAHVPGSNGGTGRRIDTNLLRDLLKEYPLIVAGGLNPRNVADIFKLAPLSDGAAPGIVGVDVASGVEGRNGRKDISLVKRFVAACRT